MRFAHDAVAYEAEEWSRPDEMALFNCLWQEARRELDARPDSVILDLCCGSGMSLVGVVSHPHARQVIGVDISEELLDFARSRFLPFQHLSFVCADAVVAPLAPAQFDLILASSAYHHIDDQRKTQFLDQCHSLLKEDGQLLVAENVLPPYVDREVSYDLAVTSLYEAVTTTALQAYPVLPSSIREMIQENVRLSICRQYEFKVDRATLLADIGRAGFVVDREYKPWPSSADNSRLPEPAGNFLFVLRKR